jgi:hypothetical protein
VVSRAYTERKTMGIFSKLLGREHKSTANASSCDFCGHPVTRDNAKVALIKGIEALADFEKKIKRKHKGPPSHYDPKDGEPVFFACTTCLMQYSEKCSKCGAVAGDLRPTVIQGETSGKEVEALLCMNCLTDLLEAGGTFNGFRR